MKVKIRLARWGSRNNNFFGIVAAPVRFARDGRHLDSLGTYNPIPYREPNLTSKTPKTVATKHLELNVDRIKYWLSVGAQASGTMHNMLISAGVTKGKKINVLPKKSPPASAQAPASETKEATEAAPAEAVQA